MIRGLAASDIPASGIARDFISPVTVHSAPNTAGTGLALRLGHARPDPIHPGLVSLPGSQSVLDNLSLTLRQEPGSQAPREGSDALPCPRLFHGLNLGEVDEQDGAKNLRGFANVRS